MTTRDLATATDRLVDRSAQVRWESLDEQTRDATRRVVTDALGVAAGGLVAPGVEPSLKAYELAAGDGPVVVPWWGRRLAPSDAAMALSLLIHAWDFDDTHDAAVVHASSVTVPAALATAQAADVSGREMLAGVVAGIEMVCRLSLAVGVQPGVIRTAGLGSIGAAAAAARTLGLDSDGMRRAVSLALPVAMSPTTRQPVEDSAINKRHQPGFMVRQGITSAFLAAEGVSGPEGWFTGSYGLSECIDDELAAARSMATPGWEVSRLSLKPIPACRYTHAAVDAALSLTGGSPAADVARVRVHLPSGSTHALVGRPWARRGEPLVDAQFSVPWLLAAALEHGFVDLTTMTGPALLDPQIEARARSVEVLLDQHSSRSMLTPVTVELIGADGTEGAATVQDVRGSPERPLSWEEIMGKAAACIRAAGRSASSATALGNFADALDHHDVRDVVDMLDASAVPA